MNRSREWANKHETLQAKLWFDLMHSLYSSLLETNRRKDLHCILILRVDDDHDDDVDWSGLWWIPRNRPVVKWTKQANANWKRGLGPITCAWACVKFCPVYAN